ncbi:hypothetical protein DB346_20995 [Verrucomicrobia bacterium LW23]|nr:hypothetical protein DB346_20995 [Verrucomicrobia bacterium LW23]
MSTPTTTSTPGHLLLFRGNNWHQGLSAEQIQQIMTRWYAWFDRLTREGKLKAGQPLAIEGRVVAATATGAFSVTDGPFAESKEAVGGYFLLAVDDIDEAVAIAQQCPALPHGLQIEVRPIAGMCAVQSQLNAAREQEALVGASA